MRRRRCRRATPFTGALRGRGPIYRFGFFAGPAWKAAEKGKRKNAGEPAWLPRASAVCHFRLCGVRRLAQRFNRRVRGGHAGTKEKNKNRRRVELRRFFSVLSGKGGLHPAGRDPRGESLRSGGGPEADACRAAASFCGFAASPPLAAPGPGSKRAAVRAWRDAGPTPRAGLCRSAPRPFLFALPRSAASRDVFPRPAVALSGCGPVRLRPVAFGCIRLWLRSTPFGDDLPHAAASGFGRVRPRFTASGLSCRQIGPAASAAERGFRPCRPGRGRSYGWSG